MVFHNQAIMNIIGIKDTKDLHALLAKHLFTSREHGNHLSLITAAQSRYSDIVLSQTYKYSRKKWQSTPSHDQSAAD